MRDTVRFIECSGCGSLSQYHISRRTYSLPHIRAVKGFYILARSSNVLWLSDHDQRRHTTASTTASYPTTSPPTTNTNPCPPTSPFCSLQNPVHLKTNQKMLRATLPLARRLASTPPRTTLRLNAPSFRQNPKRRMTTDKKPKEEPKIADQYGQAGSVSTEVLTPGEKVVNAGWNLWYLGLAGLAVTCGGYIFMELNPFGSSPQTVMNAR